ncbi:hypothetical protein, partial [Mesorhizobium sp. M1D.F.Ca.ET.231.01.1.1]|uniref:hypothetical protein n=1 Tax=Mesorhizobium sp. M1D.F.Ca.ET.231.01.1.1 TaxID=2496669 RepID=UPI001AEE9FB5
MPGRPCAGLPALVNALANRTAETLSAVEGARSTLAESVADLIGRMGNSSAQLGPQPHADRWLAGGVTSSRCG